MAGDIKSILQNCFDFAYEKVNNEKYHMNSQKKLQYFDFKPFFDTVIEFLNSLDESFVDADINEHITVIQSYEKTYEKLYQTSHDSKEQLFKQTYINQDTYFLELSKKLKLYAYKYKQGKIKLQNIKAAKAAEKRKTILTKLSILKKAYIDCKSEVVEYEAMAYETFSNRYDQTLETLKKEITSILNTKAYLFNKAIFKRANELNAVKVFCSKNEIEGYLDAKTFLKHYLQTTNIPAESNTYKDLVKVSQILSSQKRKSILIVHDDLYELERMKNALQNHDKDLVIKGYVDYKQLLKGAKLEVDLVILDYAIRGLKADVSTIRQSYNQSDFLLLFEKGIKEDIVHAHQNKVFDPQLKNCILKPQHLKARGLTQKVVELL